MNYIQIYNDIIVRAKCRVLNSYVERHHIVPKCLGGSNDPKNLVDLTPEEHYIVHLLLVKIHPNNRKIIFAANMMSNRNNKSYGWIKKKFAIEIKISNKEPIGWKLGRGKTFDQSGIKNPMYGKRICGSKSLKAKSYTIVSNDGTEYTVKCLKEFVSQYFQENIDKTYYILKDLASRKPFQVVVKGKLKGWKIKHGI